MNNVKRKSLSDIGYLVVRMKQEYNIPAVETINVYNSCMDYMISKHKVYFGNDKEIALMAERFLTPVSVYKNGGK